MYTSEVDDQPGPSLQSSMFSLSGTDFFSAVCRSINLGIQPALALRLLLAVFSSKISSDVNPPFGDELERAWNSLKWTEKLTLLISVVRGMTSSLFNLSDTNLKISDTNRAPFNSTSSLVFLTHLSFNLLYTNATRIWHGL